MACVEASFFSYLILAPNLTGHCAQRRRKAEGCHRMRLKPGDDIKREKVELRNSFQSQKRELTCPEVGPLAEREATPNTYITLAWHGQDAVVGEVKAKQIALHAIGEHFVGQVTRKFARRHSQRPIISPLAFR